MEPRGIGKGSFLGFLKPAEGSGAGIGPGAGIGAGAGAGIGAEAGLGVEPGWATARGTPQKEMHGSWLGLANLTLKRSSAKAEKVPEKVEVGGVEGFGALEPGWYPGQDRYYLEALPEAEEEGEEGDQGQQGRHEGAEENPSGKVEEEMRGEMKRDCWAESGIGGLTRRRKRWHRESSRPRAVAGVHSSGAPPVYPTSTCTPCWSRPPRRRRRTPPWGCIPRCQAPPRCTPQHPRG